VKIEAKVVTTFLIGLLWIWASTGCLAWISSASSIGVVGGTLGVVILFLLNIRLLILIWKGKSVENTSSSSGPQPPVA